MYLFLNSRRLSHVLENAEIDSNIIYENKITRKNFLNYLDKNKLEEYLTIKKNIYGNFKKFLESENYYLSRAIFENSTIYGLQNTFNIYNCNNWTIYKDIFEIAIKTEYDKFVWFYENILNRIEIHIKRESIDDNKLIFYDNAWKSNYEINFNILKKFSNTLFRDLVYHYSINYDDNTAKYKILKYLIKSNNVELEHIYYSQNTVCDIGDLEMFKFLDSQVFINYNIEYGDFFRLACSKGHVEIAKILYDKGVNKLNSFDFDNIFYIVCRDCLDVDTIKWLSSVYNGKHINKLKTLFNSRYYNNETKKYLMSIGYSF